MSLTEPGEPRIQEIIDAARAPTKCRIPQRLLPRSVKATLNRPKSINNSELVQHRPKSAGRNKEEQNGNKEMHYIRSARPKRDKLLPAPKASQPHDLYCFKLKINFLNNIYFVTQRPSIIPKRTNAILLPNKALRPLIVVPVTQKQPGRCSYMNKNISELPDQERIQKREELELQQSEMFNTSHAFGDLTERESITSRSDNVKQLKISWQEKNVQFEKMKNDLKDRQRLIMELYATMRSTQQKMSALGQKAILPSADDLKIMNVAKLTPEQLLQLCATTKQHGDKSQHDDSRIFPKSCLTIDMNKLLNMPSKLITTCEQTLAKRKEIIDWFESLKTLEKGISMHKLSKKINEFYAENEMLACSLDTVKADIYTELNEIIDFLRKGINETIALQLRTEELTYELSELNSQNVDLRKQIYNADHLKSQTNRGKIEQLEKDLKEEKCKKIMIRDRLTRAERQIKIGTERASQLEAALEQARTQTWTLERSVQQLQDQNQKLQIDFDKELNKLTQSIRENTAHLEEIADAREKLQTEKEDLEKRLKEESEHYNESLKSMKHEINMNGVKVIETDKKYKEEIEERKKLQEKLETLHAQLLESELRNNELNNELKDKEIKLDIYMNYQTELEKTKCELSDVNIQVEKYKNQLTQQNEAIKEVEHNFEENLKRHLSIKDDYISELDKKQSLLEQQLQESEMKMYSYEEQLMLLKGHIAQLKADFGEFENLTELNEMINQQRNKLLEVTRQNGELVEALQNKDTELERQLENLTEHEQLLYDRDNVIKMLSKKDDEQTNIIKLLRNNLEMRVQADTDLNQQILEKKSQIESLVNNLEENKHEISQLETIILTLKDQRLNDQDKITTLENKIRQYESMHLETKHGTEIPTNNLDDLIKILENELGMPLESEFNDEKQEYPTNRKFGEDHKHDKLINFDYLYHSKSESVPTKIVMSNFIKKTYIPAKDEVFKSDNLDRKKAIANIDMQKWVSAPDPKINTFDTIPINKSNFPRLREVTPRHYTDINNSSNLRCLDFNHLREGKKCKMFKLAGHRL
ncbi:LOW QUALITY PROTEIN: myosin heavy chain, striated muscle-like [Galleria mellonella]|uniref:LOW QUALITY PROTEIN: myosin heavy chain, striated muscle-like n=1 Tax=Galleria mellonella TaxID=7137 RepID=A0ABM3MJI3_GALME|nr:LOW QUALITY PROTEIN: myosin heavy chain, striated muscle-like [Galleria mellonella]